MAPPAVPGSGPLLCAVLAAGILLRASLLLSTPRSVEVSATVPTASRSESVSTNLQTAIGPHPSATYPNGCDTLPVVVHFTSTTTGGVPPYAYQWSFGDGTPNSTSADPSHSYAAFGLYDRELSVTDSDHARAFSNFSFYVGVAPCPTVIATWWPSYPTLAITLSLFVGLVVGAAGFARYRRQTQR